MSSLSPGARRLPPHHITVRVPWHDSAWNGSLCSRPEANTSCLVLPRISMNKKDAVEQACAGRRLDELKKGELPPCLAERVSFMADFDIHRSMTHPYANSSPDTHGHFLPTPFVQPKYSAACVPFRWMLRQQVEGDAKKGTSGIAEDLGIGWVADREPELSFDTDWIQEAGNQLALLDTFFSAMRPQESLCFFYAKRTPLSEQGRRVIVGVGRVLSVGDSVEYERKGPDSLLRCVLWERNIGHSIRPGFADGFLFPYQEILAAAGEAGLDPERFAAFAPDEHFDAYSYGSELLTHDGAVASLVACAAALERIREVVEGPWDDALAWVDRELNRLWTARGAFPGLGSALSAFGYEWGFQHGSLLAYEIELERERAGVRTDPWKLVDAVFADPFRLDASVARHLTPNLCKAWQNLSTERRAFLQLLSRFAIREEQTLRFYDSTSRKDAGIEVSAPQLLKNPYLLFERDRHQRDAVAFGTVDRGLFPDAAVRDRDPVPEPSRVDDPTDWRRVRALVTDLLERAANQGHTVLPEDWLIRRARESELQPPCPLGESVLETMEPTFSPVVSVVEVSEGRRGYQVDRLVECRDIIRREVRGRKKGRRHALDLDWRAEVDRGLDTPLPEGNEDRALEERARDEKAAGLQQLVESRLSVLIGPAGTGKTTLLRMLCSIPEVEGPGILLLAPTGKARVRLEEQTGLRGKGKTLAQFLNAHQRYDGANGRHHPSPGASRCTDYRTVIVDESSMLTEEQLAALFDACTNVDRYVLVGDPKQLPPIGAGKPFVDIVRDLVPADIETRFPRCAPGYAELTIPRRQLGADRTDVLLASHFVDRPLDPGADSVWDLPDRGDAEKLRFVQWFDPRDLQQKMYEEIEHSLGLAGPDDQLGFEMSLGGSAFGEIRDRAFFWSRFKDNPGAASMVESWQMLSPVRAGLEGVDALNRAVQETFRAKWREKALEEGYRRKIPRPFGAQGIVYGDKVINVINQRRRDVWPELDGEAYLANGDLGVVVGQYKGKTSKIRGLPKKLEVEFAGQLGHKYGFWPGEFGDDAPNPLELAYALTVHKTQGSEFGITFVVIPDPCWLLSRELLYTAFTRHKNRLVVLHQGAREDLRRFAGPEYSEIARRMTNLFAMPSPREVSFANTSLFLEEGLIHRAESGHLVRSKSELVIADKLHGRGVEFGYEQRLTLPDGRTRYPDFTVADHSSGITYYWEHLGMLGDPNYRAGWERKKAEYLAAGVLPWQDGGGPAGTLIETRDDENGGLDSREVARIIDEVILG